MKSLFASAVLLIAALGQAYAQGDLDPPAGAPAPSMKTLQEIWDKVAAVQTDAAGIHIVAAISMSLRADTSFDNTSKYAWSANTGWTNSALGTFSPDAGTSTTRVVTFSATSETVYFFRAVAVRPLSP